MFTCQINDPLVSEYVCDFNQSDNTTVANDTTDGFHLEIS